MSSLFFLPVWFVQWDLPHFLPKWICTDPDVTMGILTHLSFFPLQLLSDFIFFKDNMITKLTDTNWGTVLLVLPWHLNCSHLHLVLESLSPLRPMISGFGYSKWRALVGKYELKWDLCVQHRFWVTGFHSSKEDERFWACFGLNHWVGNGEECVKSPVLVCVMAWWIPALF